MYISNGKIKSRYRLLVCIVKVGQVATHTVWLFSALIVTHFTHLIIYGLKMSNLVHMCYFENDNIQGNFLELLWFQKHKDELCRPMGSASCRMAILKLYSGKNNVSPIHNNRNNVSPIHNTLNNAWISVWYLYEIGIIPIPICICMKPIWINIVICMKPKAEIGIWNQYQYLSLDLVSV